MSVKGEHLTMIQAAIGRMAGNSFLIKGWAATLIAGLSAFAAKDSDNDFAVVAMGTGVLFWFLDAYYLALERRFRDLFKTAAENDDDDETDWNMSPGNVSIGDLFTAFGRPAVVLVYLPLIAAAGAIAISA